MSIISNYVETFFNFLGSATKEASFFTVLVQFDYDFTTPFRWQKVSHESLVPVQREETTDESLGA